MKPHASTHADIFQPAFVPPVFAQHYAHPKSTPADLSAFEAAFSGSRGFDFLFGSWNVSNRRLLKRLENCNEWEEFEATSVCHPILGGVGNQDEFISPHRPGFIGMSLRLFNPQTQKWSIYWMDNQSGALQPPVEGSFFGGEGLFEGEDEFNGKPILVRFLWSRTNTPTPRWEQAFSSDRGLTWESNWTMDFSRATPSI